MSKILAIDTSTSACSAALLLGENLTERYEVAPRQHAKLILPMVQDLLANAKIKLSELDAIAFGCGPGSFTGIRIAAGITQGLAFGADLPVVPISSLQALAQGAYRELGARKVVAGFDARMQEVYWGVYQLDNNYMTAIRTDSLCKPDEVSVPIGDDWISVGDAWNDAPYLYPRARDVAILGDRDFQLNKAVAADKALPIYLRDKTTWEKSPNPIGQ